MLISQIISCPICLSDLQEPVSISCGHTMCNSCLVQILANQQTPNCPLCRKPVFAPVGDIWQIDYQLVEVIRVLKENGEEALIQEFPQIVGCLDCGLTPISPVVLTCQHLFCLECIKVRLESDLICPACNEWATYIPDSIPVNTKYSEILEWYVNQIKNGTKEEEQQQFKIQEKNFLIKSVDGMPVLFYDQSAHVKQKSSLMIVEARYIQMMKIVSNGSGHFPIMNLIKTDEDLPMYGDLVVIEKIQIHTKQQIHVDFRGSHRIVIKDIYTLGQGGDKIPFNIQLYKNLAEQLWMINFDIVEDSFGKDEEGITKNWSNILNILQTCFEGLNPKLKELFLPAFQQICIGNQQKIVVKDLKLIQDASLFLIRLLKIRSNDYFKLYYTDSIQGRIQYIGDYLQQIQYQLIQKLSKESNKKKNLDLEKPLKIEIPQMMINLPSIDDDDEDLDENDLQLISFKELTDNEHIFMNLFKLVSVIQSQD